MNTKALIETAALRRADAVTMIHDAKTGHTGGSMSVCDILACLYYDVLNVDPKNPKMENRDRFFMSKGHSVEALWAILADRGFFPKERLKTFSQAGSPLIGHPNNKVAGVEMCTGALGHGLPVAVGAALGAKRQGAPWRCYCVMGDGEQAEGSVWEAAMAAANYGLGNLWAVVDRNRLQISGSTEDVMALDDLAEKWRALGWDVTQGDGPDMAFLRDYFHSERPKDAPHMLVACTVKGKGLPFAEDRAEWHHHVPSDDQLTEAYRALGVKGASYL